FLEMAINLVDESDGSKIILIKKYLNETECKNLFDYCTQLQTKLYPFKLKQNRLLWACGDEGTYHEFRNVNVIINEWSSNCLLIRDRIQTEFDIYHNFCLINHYRNGFDSIAPHSDGELHSKNKSVFTLGIGATRKMQLIPYSSLKPKIIFDFEQGDLLLMCGNVQTKYKHGIDIEPTITKPRYSLTFRSTLLKTKKRKADETNFFSLGTQGKCVI